MAPRPVAQQYARVPGSDLELQGQLARNPLPLVPLDLGDRSLMVLQPGDPRRLPPGTPGALSGPPLGGVLPAVAPSRSGPAPYNPGHGSSRRRDGLNFGMDSLPFMGDGMGRQVLSILNARDAARQASADLSSRVFGRNRGVGDEVREVARRRGDGERSSDERAPAAPAAPAAPVVPPAAVPSRVVSAAAPAAGTRSRVRPALYTIAGGA